MYILPFIIIALCNYTSISGGGGDDKIVDLDVNTKVGTDKFIVTAKEEGSMLVYIIKPKKGYRVRLITDGNKLVYEPMKHDKLTYLEALYSNINDNEVILATLHFSLGLCRGTDVANYFLFPEGWRKSCLEFYNHLVHKMKSGEQICRENELREYFKNMELSKRKIDIDVSKESTISSDIFVEASNEGCIYTRLYYVNDKVVIGKVNYGTNLIWNLRNEEGFLGCYEMKVYYLEDTPELLILTIKDYRGSFELYYNRDDHKRYSSIKKSEFDNRLKELDERSRRMIEILKNKIEVDVAYNLIVTGSFTGTKGQGKVKDMDCFISHIINVTGNSVIYKITDEDRLVWKRDGEDVYGCYSVKVYYFMKSLELLVLNVNTSEGFKYLYIIRDGKKFSYVSVDDFYNRFRQLDESTNQENGLK